MRDKSSFHDCMGRLLKRWTPHTLKRFSVKITQVKHGLWWIFFYQMNFEKEVAAITSLMVFVLILKNVYLELWINHILYRLVSSPRCSSGDKDQTMEHILQECWLYEVRAEVRPSPMKEKSKEVIEEEYTLFSINVKETIVIKRK